MLCKHYKLMIHVWYDVLFIKSHMVRATKKNISGIYRHNSLNIFDISLRIRIKFGSREIYLIMYIMCVIIDLGVKVLKHFKFLKNYI